MSGARPPAGPGRADVLASIGGTPLIRVRGAGHDAGETPDGVEVYAKGEHLNPGGSVKDRAARAMIVEGERSGKLTPGKTILDATSGNTGIALAMIGAALGYPVTVCLPANASAERKRTLRVYGAEIIETDPLQATDGAQRRAKALAAASPERYFYTDQYNNPANWRAHYETTAHEIWEQTAGRITHFIAGLGSTGTFVGTTRKLKALNPKIRAVSMQPDLPLHGIEGMKHMGTAMVPGIYDPRLADDEVEVDTADAQETTRRLARTEGLMVGVSAGANVFAALRLARTLAAGSVVVTILCDAGGRYLADPFWAEGRAMIEIPPEVLDEIRRHGEADFPYECCGLLIGQFGADGAKVVQEVLPILNAREDEAKPNRFLITPDDLMRGEKYARRYRRDIVGFYHSHPDHPALPSLFDREHAWPVYSYVIVSVMAGKAGDLRSFVLRSDRSQFDLEDLSKGP